MSKALCIAIALIGLSIAASATYFMSKLKKGDSSSMQYMSVAVFGGLLLAIGVACFFMKKDKFVYDPILQGDNVDTDPKLVKFFESVGADPMVRVNDQRYVHACQECDRSEPRLTPSACSKCDAFMLGIRRHSQGVL
jgi:hypothetical protein